jgi:hypothetical protein
METMRFFAFTLSVFIAFAACTPVPEATPIPKLRPVKPSITSQPSIESQQASAYYASAQARLRAQGRLRQELYPNDARFTTRNLVENFERIALYDEYSVSGGQFIERQTASSLRRWERPIRIGITFGPSVTEQQRSQDTAYVRSFAQRLARLSGLNIQLTDARRANFSLLFLNKDEQRDLTPQLVGKIKYLVPQIVNEIRNSPRGIFCVAYAIEEQGSLTGYKGAVILIKGEHTDLMRKSCIQEEMTQALGLANDSPKARPSIFNDDEEFALLTRHDELLLRMLYDPRLSIGMTVDVAHPIIQQIAQDLMSSGQS